VAPATRRDLPKASLPIARVAIPCRQSHLDIARRTPADQAHGNPRPPFEALSRSTTEVGFSATDYRAVVSQPPLRGWSAVLRLAIDLLARSQGVRNRANRGRRTMFPDYRRQPSKRTRRTAQACRLRICLSGLVSID